MILETLRITLDGLRDGSTGVNATLAEIARDAADPTPRPVQAFWDVTDSRSLTKGKRPLDDPWIAVLPDGPAGAWGEVKTVYRDAFSVPVVILYGTSREGDEALAEALYTARAIVKSIRELLRESRSGDRSRNDVAVLSANSIGFGPVDEEVLGGKVKVAVTVDFYVRDTAP